MKKQNSTYPLRLPASLKGGRRRNQQGRRYKHKSVCDDGGGRESVRYENRRVLRHTRCQGRYRGCAPPSSKGWGPTARPR